MSTLPGTMESHWIDSTPATSYPALNGDVEVDAVVIGGGIAGISAAWELSHAGCTVAVLEADRVVTGVTGYTTAKLSAQHTMIYAHLRDSFGEDGARTYAQSQQWAIGHVEDVATRLGVDCELERVPAFTYGREAATVDKLRDEADAAAQAGLAASFVTSTTLPFSVAGAVRVEGQAQFHPRKYLLALADDLRTRGAQIFERSRAVGLDEGETCTVTTENGSTVTAKHVVVATHYPVFDRAMLFARLSPSREIVVAATIPADQDPGAAYITPESGTRSVRTAPYTDGQRLLIVTGEHFTPGTADVTERYEKLLAWTRETYPDARVVYRWATQDNTTTDKVPYIGLFHPGTKNVYVATGFGGWGMTNGVLAGHLIARLVTGVESPWASLYDPRRLHPLREAGPMLKLQSEVVKHFVGDRVKGSHVDSVDDIEPGSGAVVRASGERCAVYRDPDGAVHAVSAACTHLGCIVHFNDAETAWECPCHGSRFSVDGEVLQGPANRPLEPREVS